MPIDGNVQQIDALMNELKISNAELVAASTEQLTFKAVQKGRKGRALSLKMQRKILNAIRTLKPERNLALKDLFNY